MFLFLGVLLICAMGWYRRKSSNAFHKKKARTYKRIAGSLNSLKVNHAEIELWLDHSTYCYVGNFCLSQIERHIMSFSLPVKNMLGLITQLLEVHHQMPLSPETRGYVTHLLIMYWELKVNFELTKATSSTELQKLEDDSTFFKILIG